MATYMCFRRSQVCATFMLNLSSRRSNFHCNKCRNISTTTATSANQRVDKPDIDDITRAEQSWVRNMLYGSGPSADVNELEEEEEEEKFVETVQAKYMDVIQKPTVIDRPELRKRVYKPPSDIDEQLKNISLELCEGTPEADWQQVELTDNKVKYKILRKCSQVLHHSVPNFLLNQMKTMSDVAAFYQVEVKDTSKFDDLSLEELPENLRIHWEYKDDSKLEIYEDYLEYIKPKHRAGPEDVPKIRYR